MLIYFYFTTFLAAWYPAFCLILKSDYKRDNKSGPVSVLFRADRETAARITEEIGSLMKEIETLVEEKAKESSDITKMVKDGEHVHKRVEMSAKVCTPSGNKQYQTINPHFINMIQILQ